MSRALTALLSNVGISLETAWLIFIVGVSIICGVKDMRIAAIINLILSGASILLMYNNNLDYSMFVYSVILSAIILAFTISEKAQRVGDLT